MPGLNEGDILVSRHYPFTTRIGIPPSGGAISNFMQGSTNIGFADGHVERVKPNFGIGGTYLANGGGQPNVLPNNIVGLHYRYGVKFELLGFQP